MTTPSPSNDAQRAQALLSQRGAAVSCVGSKPPAHRRALRLRSLWTGLSLIAVVATAVHFVGAAGHHHASAASAHADSIVHPTPQAPSLSAVHAAKVTLASHAAVPSSPIVVPARASLAVASTVAPTSSLSTAPAKRAHPAVRTTTSSGVSPAGAIIPASTVTGSGPTSAAAPIASSAAPATLMHVNGVLQLPIAVSNSDTTLSLSKKLDDAGQTFAALSTSIEEMRTAVYYDGGGANIGMGYCITNRLANYGRAKVLADFHEAGIPDPVAVALVTRSHRVQQSVRITNEMALRLLFVVAPEYEAIARDAVGPTFDQLPAFRRATIQWLAYNTGDVASFKGLVHSVQAHNVLQAMNHMTPWYKDVPNQVMIKNERAGAYLQASYFNEKGLKTAISNPAQFEDRTLVHKESPIAVVSPDDAKALRKKGQLPVPPTTGPNTKPMPGASLDAVGASAVLAVPTVQAPSVKTLSTRSLQPVERLTPDALNRWQAQHAAVVSLPANDDQALIDRAVSGPRP